MCGIMGVIGRRGAVQVVHAGLKSLEYRGYDSCGVAWLGATHNVERLRAIGGVAELHIPDDDSISNSQVALGHTRWATHGGVTETNAHPHFDNDGTVAVVHNGVLSHFERLRTELESRGAVFQSDTDSECLAHLWALSPGDGLARLDALAQVLQGTYSVAIMDADGEIFVMKQRNPLWVAYKDGVCYLASDAVALRAHVVEATPLEDGDRGRLTSDGIELWDAQGHPVERPSLDISAIDGLVDRAGYEHFMLKEIHEIPATLNSVLAAYLRQSPPYVAFPPHLAVARRAVLLGAGTSFHAALLGAMTMRGLAGTRAEARPTPEYKDEMDIPEDDAMVVAISQSGETLDTVQALQRLRSHPHASLAITNHVRSTIARACDDVIDVHSGIEISVAATKTFLGQSLILHLLALQQAATRHSLGDAELARRARTLLSLPRAAQKVLHRSTEAQEMARHLASFDAVFVLAKGASLPAAMEGALKLKEIAYQHAEAYPAGELKHGPFALLTSETPVLFLIPPGAAGDALAASLQEVMARGAPVFAIAMEGAPAPHGVHVFRVPAVEDFLQPLVFATALHLLSYWVAKARGLPIDKPRNLAKSVTVE